VKKEQFARERIFEAFAKLSSQTIRELYRKIEKQTLKKGLIVYDEKAKVIPINVELSPWFVSREQQVFFKKASLLLRDALSELFSLYLAYPPIRKIIPLSQKEDEWFHEICPVKPQTPQSVFERLDANALFWHKDWKTSFKFIEANSVAAGGIHYIPAAVELIEELILPQLKQFSPKLKLQKLKDVRELLMEVMLTHSKQLGRELNRVVFIEDRSYQEGTDELSSIAEFFNQRGIKAFVADPRQLHLKKGKVCYDDTPVDIIYRDSELEELIEMEEAGDSIEAIREAFKENRVISGFSGDFDHKSSFEVFTSSEFKKCFTQAQRGFFRKHVAWTRLIWERKTKDKKEKKIDLIKYIRSNRTELVIKPNRACGGEGVVIGRETNQGKWEKTLERAVKHPSTMVVQEAVPIYKDKFPVITKDGRLFFKELFVVSGFAATPSGIAFLGRSSQKQVVNVSRGGGLIAVFLVE